MEPTTARILVWLVGFALTWIAARAILAVFKSAMTDNAKATWIALIVCVPVIGAVLFWLCSGASELPNGTPEVREALLKARLNRNENQD